jgi:adenylate kinase
MMGPPGAGKGTQAVELAQKIKLPHISTGDLFREHLSQKTALGQKAKAFIDKGELVPDDLVINMLFERIAKADCKEGFILDGFPRTIEQAKALESKMQGRFRVITLNLQIADHPLVQRITGRLMCKKCGAPYHKKFLPPKVANTCDLCKGPLYQRADDTEAIVKERLSVYHKQTEPVISYFEKKPGSLYQINSDQEKEAVLKELLKTVEKIR